ncbi:hypothetical protein [Leucobacter sp. wl10]|uniref:hypothetical protein n=1 Tax=Leucobacter sp. wl10 TaxID=2304677 RepID=UPI000E5A7D7C|nr:hypothetical protein [Leucobacter sp. wl10]RGE20341.1 hypothetical protein D1J51_09150 [Leucobacter sp. wl10]
MPTLEDALTATLTAEAVEASFLQAVSGIQLTENAYVSPRDDVSRSTIEFVMPDTDAPAERSRAETIAHAGALHTRTAGGEWITLDLPRPALGPLALLTILYGADLEQPVAGDGAVIEVELSASLATERVPDELRSTLDDLLSATDPAGDGRFPEHSTARLRVHEAPLHIAEATITTTLSGGSAATFALEIHPTPARTINIPDSNESEVA